MKYGEEFSKDFIVMGNNFKSRQNDLIDNSNVPKIDLHYQPYNG